MKADSTIRTRAPRKRGVIEMPQFTLLLVAMSLVIAACGGTDDGATTTAAPDDASTTTQVEATETTETTETTVGGEELSPEIQAAADAAAALGLGFVTSHDEIVAGAEAEDGKLVVQTSTSDFQVFKDAFEADYPFIELEWVELSGAATERMLIEVESGQASRYDVGYPAPEAYNVISDLMGWDLYGMAEAGILTIPLASIDEENHVVVAAGSSGIALAYNSDLVAEADLPQSWEDLADPKWGRDQLGMAMDVDLNNVSVLATSPDWGIERVVELMSQIAANEPIYVDGHVNAALLVQSGEVAISPFINLHSAVREYAKDPEGPLQIHFIEPVPIRASEAYGVFSDQLAEAPYSGLLFVEWIANDDDAQELLDADPLQASLNWAGSDMAEMIGDREVTIAVPAAVTILPDWIEQIHEAAGFPQITS